MGGGNIFNTRKLRYFEILLYEWINTEVEQIE